MQLTAMQEQMDRVIPAWCMENGFGEDPVTVSTFTELAVRLLSILPSDPSQDACMPALESDLRLADECLLADTVTDDSFTQNVLRPYAKGETVRTQSQGLLGATAADPSPSAQPAHTACGRSPSVEWMPDCSGHWRPLLHGDEWWVAGHYMMCPVRNEADAERLCQELVSQN